jgi:2-phosphosulfolactate phosphatase
VAFLPDAIEQDVDWSSTTAVVIDVLRATTVMCTALAAGAQRILPVQDVDAARAAARALAGAAAAMVPHPAGEPTRVLLAGERQCRRVPGFDLGNSPAEYTTNRVAGAMIVLSTTNGTRATTATRFAHKTLAAAFLNASAAIAHLRAESYVYVVCAGTEGQVSAEDAWLAGLIVDQLSDTHRPANDGARLVRDAWRQIAEQAQTPGGLAALLTTSLGGQQLIRAGFSDDLVISSHIDRLSHVPQRNASNAEFR